MSRLRWQTWLALASCAAMVVGAFGPWIKASAGFVSLSVSGTDGSNDGWGIVALAVAGAAAVIAADLRDNGWLAVASGLAGIGGVLVAGYDRRNVNDRIAEADVGEAALVQVGWGLNLALAASAGLTVACMVLLFRAADRADRNPEPETPSEPPAPEARMAPSQHASTQVDELERLAALRASGALSEDEFASAKARILSSGDQAGP